MENLNLDRKDNRLLSSLTDLKLENVKNEIPLEEVHSILSFRVKERQEKWVHWGPSMTIRSMKISYRSFKERLSTIRLSSSKAWKHISPFPHWSRIKKSKNCFSKNSSSARWTRVNTWWSKIAWPAPFSSCIREDWLWRSTEFQRDALSPEKASDSLHFSTPHQDRHRSRL